MPFLGEILALLVAVLWTISSLASEIASHHYGSLLLNILRMVQSVVFIGLVLWAVTGNPIPCHANSSAWTYLALSSLAGYIIGDFFFLQCFILIGARWGELFMTVAPLAAALTGWALLGEQMTTLAWLGMFITTGGICLSVLSKGEEGNLKVKLPAKGIIYGLLAGIGQGVGLVFSKIGMLHYREGILDVANYALVMPFAATMIRCLVALVGFVAVYALLRAAGKEHHPASLLLTRGKVLWAATISTVFGPFVGVALSLAATMFTSTGITQTLMALVPVLILWPSHLLFHTKVTLKEIVGAIISVLGVALFFV